MYFSTYYDHLLSLVSLLLLVPPHARPLRLRITPQAIAVEDVIWIRLFNILYRKHKSWMRKQGTPPTWDRDQVQTAAYHRRMQ